MKTSAATRIVAASAALALASAALAASAHAATITVNSAADAGGTCPSSTTCTLRAAIVLASATIPAPNQPPDDTIEFAIGAAGSAATIKLASDLPSVDGATVIDGWTQGGAGYAGPPLIELQPDTVTTAVNGILLSGGHTTFRGFVVNGFSGDGVRLEKVGANAIVGDYIGTNAAGTAAAANGTGVHVVGTTVANTSPSNEIGHAVAGEGNIISGNSGAGVLIDSLSNANVIRANRIGTNAAGTAAIANGGSGVTANGYASVIGGSASSQRNVISGNTLDGVTFTGLNTNVRGNFIGTDGSGAGSLPNGRDGVRTSGSLFSIIGGFTAGAGNRIAFNPGNGITVIGSGVPGNAIRGNSIFSNGKLGIDLVDAGDPPSGVTANDPGDGDSGPNGLQNFPVLTGAQGAGLVALVNGTLASAANTTYRIDVFASPPAGCDPSGNGEGQTYLGSTDVTTDGAGNATWNAAFFGAPVTTGGAMTATATSVTGQVDDSTSEFSACRTIDPLPPPAIEFEAFSTSVDVHESSGPAVLNLSRAGLDLAGTSTVKVKSSSGSAHEPTDYDSVDQVLTFNPFSFSEALSIPVHRDSAVTGTKDFTLTLSDPTGATLGGATQATVHILDDDLQTSGGSGGQGGGNVSANHRRPRSRISATARRSRKSKGRVFRGVASDPDGDLKSVSVAIVAMRGGARAAKARKRCLSLRASGRLKSVKLRRGRCRPTTFLKAKGVKRWSFKLKRRLPPGYYALYSRALDKTGLKEIRFSRRLRNRVIFRVLAPKPKRRAKAAARSPA